MTFNEIVTAVQNRLNITSSASTTRIGTTVNDRYRRVMSAIGLGMTRRSTVSETVTLGVSTVVFSGCEKIINVVDRSVTPYRILKEVTVEELRRIQPFVNSFPTHYAIVAYNANSVTIEMDCIPQAAFDLYADVQSTITTLSGSNTPNFPEDFHDILVHGGLADEYRKMEKLQLAQDSEQLYTSRLSDLRMWLAKSSYLDHYQGKTRGRMLSGSAVSGAGGGSGSVNGASSYTQTGLITFDRSGAGAGSAPFAVDLDAAGKVDNLNADLLDGLNSTAFAQLASNETVTGNWTFTGVLIVPVSASPAQTAEGSIVWDSDDDLLTVGTGAGRKTLVSRDTTETLQNKTLDNTNVVTVKDANLTIQDDSDTTKQAKFQASGITTGQTRVLTIPNFDGTIATLAGTETLSNKTLAGPITSGQVKAADGSVGAPSYAFETELDCGLYKEGTNAIALGTAGTKALGIDSTQFIDSPTQPRARAYNSNVQSINSAIFTALTFDSEDYDVGGLHSTVSNTSRMTVPTGGDGLYLIKASSVFAANATGIRAIRIRKNGTTELTGSQRNYQNAGAGNLVFISVDMLEVLVADDYVEALVYQDSGGALNAGSATTELRSQLSIVKLW